MGTRSPLSVEAVHVGPPDWWTEVYRPSRRTYWADRLMASDPGLQRLRAGLEVIVSVALTVAAEWAFVHYSHALRFPAPHGLTVTAAARAVATGNHDAAVIATMLGALVAFLLSVGTSDVTAPGQLVSMFVLSAAMSAGLSVSVALASHRVAWLVVLAILFTAGAWCRGLGSRGLVGGVLLCMGAVVGYSIRTAVPPSEIGWPVAELGIGTAIAVGVRFSLFPPRPAAEIRRMQRSWAARARVLAEAAARAFESPVPEGRPARRLHLEIARLNETALVIEAQVARFQSLSPGFPARLFSERLFDMELALSNACRFAAALGAARLPDDQRQVVGSALRALRSGDLERAVTAAGSLMRTVRAVSPAGERNQALVHRFAAAVSDFGTTESAWLVPASGLDDDGEPFRAAAPAAGGKLPGAALVSARASATAGTRRGEQVALRPHLRAAAQMAVAATVALTAGSLLSGTRFYWAMLAVLVTFMSVTHAGEQIRRATFRVAGTAAGIILGSVAAQLAGHQAGWVIAVVLAASFVGRYLIQVNYTYFVIALTVVVSELYVQLGEYSSQLLLLRLEETAIGAAAAIAAAAIVLPLRPLRVISVAARAYFASLDALVDRAAQALAALDAADLRRTVRDLDAAYQALAATAGPLRPALLGAAGHRVDAILAAAAATRYHGRDLARNIGNRATPGNRPVPALAEAMSTLRDGISAILAAGNDPVPGPYTRAAGLFDRAERHTGENGGPCASVHRYPATTFPLYDLALIDAALAQLASELGMPIRDADIVAEGADGM